MIFDMDKIRVGVVGTGHVGSVHARLYKEIDSCSLNAICDTHKSRLVQLSEQLGVPGYLDYKELFDKVDAVSIATPPRTHYTIAADFLKHRIHTLVEKPFTPNLIGADSLIKLAKKFGLILQVGHIERFNSVFAATKRLIAEPRFIECHRLGPFPHRSLDVGAVLDIMIHDIDIVLGLVPAKIKRIDAVGVNVITNLEDIANSRITFSNGCVANLTASRVSDEVMRKIRIFQQDTYISLDYKEAKANIYKRIGSAITKESLPIEREQPLEKELESFLDCILYHKTPVVSGEVARQALAVALQIQRQIWRKRKY